MEKHITAAIAIAILASLYTGCATGISDGQSSTIRTSQFDGAQGSCTNGGVKIEVLVDGELDDTQTQYICNGVQGGQGQAGGGQSGSSTTMRTTLFTDAQGSCTEGGVKIEVLVNGVVDEIQTQYICNGMQGQGETNTSIQTSTFEGNQGSCINGGIKVVTLVDGVVDEALTKYFCNDTNGSDGGNSQSGHNTLIATSDEVGTNCANGGILIDVGLDANDNGSLDADEILSSRYICNGVDGQDGEDGSNASIQTTAFDGEQGNCTNGGVKVDILIDGVVQADQTQYICNGVDGQDGQDDIGLTLCGDVLVNTLSNAAHCGGCDTKCNDGSVCEGGKCTEGIARWTYCGDKPVNTQLDDLHCGACNTPCEAGYQCTDGVCQSGDRQYIACNGEWIDAHNDDNHCGTCGVKCNKGYTCYNGSCKQNSAGYCNHIKVDLWNDFANCGACGVVCSANSYCKYGSCKSTLYTPSSKATKICNGDSITGNAKLFNCGRCGNQCNDGLTCEYTYKVDQSGYYNNPSAGTGYENMGCNVYSDTYSCSKFSEKCAKPTKLDAPVICNNKITTFLDVLNCGKCGNACGNGQYCASGVCTNTTSLSQVVNCDGFAVIRGKDDLNCGACGNQCPKDTKCTNGACTPSTAGTGHICNGDSIGDLHTDARHCGQCGHVCAEGLSCEEGTCKVPSCTVDCRGEMTCNGKTVNVDTDLEHCGACNHPCGDMEACIAGKCIGSAYFTSAE